MDIMISTRRGNLLNSHERTLRLQHYYELPVVFSKKSATQSHMWTKIKTASKSFIENIINKISSILFPNAEINYGIPSRSVFSSINESALTQTPKVDPAEAKWEFPNKKPPSAQNYENNKRRKLYCSTHSQTDILEAPEIEKFKREVKSSNKENDSSLNDLGERIKRRVIKKVIRKKLEIAKGPELEVIKGEEKKLGNKEVIEVLEESKVIRKKVIEDLTAPNCDEVKENLSDFASTNHFNSICPTPEIRTPKLPPSINLAMPIVHTPANFIQIYPEDAETTKRLPAYFPSYPNTENTLSYDPYKFSTNPTNEFHAKPTNDIPLHATEVPYPSASQNPPPMAKDPKNNPFLNPDLVKPTELHYEFGRSSAPSTFPQFMHHPEQNFPSTTFGNPSSLFNSSIPCLNQEQPKMPSIIDCDMEICEPSNQPVNSIDLPRVTQTAQNPGLFQSTASSPFNSTRVFTSESISAPSSERTEPPNYTSDNLKVLFNNHLMNRTTSSSENQISMNPEVNIGCSSNKSLANPYNHSVFQNPNLSQAQSISTSLLFLQKSASLASTCTNITGTSASTKCILPNLPAPEGKGFSLGVISTSGKRK